MTCSGSSSRVLMLDIDVDVGCWMLDVAVVGCWMVTVLPGRFQDDEGTKEI